MIDVQKVNDTKEKILSAIRTAGPSFPTRISREAGISPLFIGALLSEMVSEKKLVMSSMKVGSSPLYFVPGQEARLEGFTNYLNPKEKEAVARLKETHILDDEEQDPALRVALRKIKDFAIPITAHKEETEKLFWKFFTTTDDEAKKLIEKRISPLPEPAAPEERKNDTPHVEVQEPEKEQSEKKKEKKIVKEKKVSTWGRTIQEHLASKNIELLEELQAKAKEYNARIKIDTLLGAQEYLLLAKEKKKLTEDDLAIALHRAQLEKMPVLILTTGDLDKTARPYLDQWKNLLKLEKIKI